MIADTFAHYEITGLRGKGGKGEVCVVSVSIGDGEEPDPGVAVELLETDFHDSAGSSFAVSPDGDGCITAMIGEDA